MQLCTVKPGRPRGLCVNADNHKADMTVYGNVFVRPVALSNTGRRRLQQAGTSQHALAAVLCFTGP